MILALQMLYFEDLSIGLTEVLNKTVDSSDVVGFAEVTGDRNPIHLSEHFAAQTPFGTRIAHGLYTASLISAVLGTRLPGPGAIYISQTLNFRAPVRIGDTVEVKVTVAELMPACFAYAGLHLLLALPLQLMVLPKAAKTHDVEGEAPTLDPRFASRIPREGAIFALLAIVLSLTAGIGSIVVVHLLIFLQARGVDATAAVALGTLFGPAQVAARVVERLFGNRYHPIWTMVGSCLLMAGGLTLLSAQAPLLPLIILIYGAGYGISWIGRGTLPLALFGPERFPRLMGRLAFPSLIVQALAPSAGALIIETSGIATTLAVLTALAFGNLILIGALWVLSRRSSS